MHEAPRQLISAHLSSEPAGAREFRAAWIMIAASAAVFVVAICFARQPLVEFPVFIPIYVTTLVLCDLVTAVLLFGQYRARMSPGLLMLAGGYFFTATATAAYALIFPGLFAPTGLFGAGPQTSSAMYMFWHAGFPMLVMLYALTKRPQAEAGRAQRADADAESAAPRLNHAKARARIWTVIAAVLLAVAAFTAFATQGQELLPVFLDVNRTTVTGKVFLIGIWLLALVALILHWQRRPHAVLDVWLYVVLSAWLFDIALSAVLNTGRYDLGWYAGRIYGLVAACYLLIVLLSENARHYDRLVQNSADLRTANETLLQMSMQDGLTGLAHRRAFDTYLAEQMAIAQRHKRALTLLVVDADHFKAYNDQYGHQAGDDCLKAIADALRTSCHRPGDLAARHGGEEFSLILPDTDRAGAAHMAAAVLDAVARLGIPHARSTSAPCVSVSIGAAILPTEASTRITPAQLSAQADAALYRAKANGRNQAVISDGEEAWAAPARHAAPPAPDSGALSTTMPTQALQPRTT
ncbi:sensor domain-containing diguanylate cyclase [Dongia rigui]|uniref:diguanylate cyclase n=1 Tax=Dongia rigui TaxID=940149 RepID=A0ABU5DWR9_9PROT|nr:GGDEF domain-containing protein [Dongia rigui]MDY0871021.1 GGDEF domain-containing protein [Dongia rigui]